MTTPTPIGTASSIATSLTTTQSFARTISAGPNLCETLFPFYMDGSSKTVVSATWTKTGGSPQSFAQVSGATLDQAITGDARTGVGAWRLLAPDPGAGTIDIVWSASCVNGAFSETWQDVDQTTPAANGTSGGTAVPVVNPTLAVTNAAGDVAIGLCGAEKYGTFTANNTQIGTSITDTVFTNKTFILEYSTATNPTLGWTLTTASPFTGGSAQIGFSLKGASAPPATSMPPSRLIG